MIRYWTMPCKLQRDWKNSRWIWTDWKIRLIRYGKNFGNFEMLDKASQV